MATNAVSILFKRIGNDMYPKRHINVGKNILDASKNETTEFVNFVLQLDVYLSNCITRAEREYSEDINRNEGENFFSVAKNIRVYILSNPDVCWMLYRREHKKGQK